MILSLNPSSLLAFLSVISFRILNYSILKQIPSILQLKSERHVHVLK